MKSQLSLISDIKGRVLYYRVLFLVQRLPLFCIFFIFFILVNQSSRERRRQPKQKRVVNEGSVEREVDDNRPTLEENGIPVYRKKKQPTKRRSRNGMN